MSSFDSKTMDEEKKKAFEQTADGFDFLSNDSLDHSTKFDLSGGLPTLGLTSTTRPLLTPPGGDDDDNDDNKTPSPGEGVIGHTTTSATPLTHSETVPPSDPTLPSANPPSLIDFGGDEGKSSTAVPASDKPAGHDAAVLSIDANQPCDPQTLDTPATAPDQAPSVVKKTELEKREDASKVPEIGSHLGSETVADSRTEEDLEYGACDTIAQQPTTTVEKKAAAMEGETSVSTNKADGCCCPFSPGAFFDPNKLHPTVAEFVYWRDVKKSGICFGSSLLLLLSLKYFSFISVAAYLTLAVLCVTISFRIYKNVLQAVQKSNEGHPFKEYLDMDINLSHEKLKDGSEVLIHHMNSVTNKLRSLILVEDLFDTLKLVVFAWCMTYIGAWFNGMTVIILGLVSAFTLPKVYETNKSQIDTYAEILRVKCKEVMDMINAKMPLGKKKKDE